MKKFTTMAISILLILGLVAGLCSCSKTSSKEDTKNTTTITATEETTISSTTMPSEETTISEPRNTWEITFDGLVGPKNFIKEFEYPFHYTIIDYNDQACLILDIYTREVWLADLERNAYECISGDQKIINYTVTATHVYWFNYNKEVWVVDMYEGNHKPSLFCKNAIGVSPYTDEWQGAIVAPENSNYNSDRLQFPLYSPYGDGGQFGEIIK